MKLSIIKKMMEIIFHLNKKDQELLILIFKTPVILHKQGKLPLITMQIRNNQINKIVNPQMIIPIRKRVILVKLQQKAFQSKMLSKDQFKSNNKP